MGGLPLPRTIISRDALSIKSLLAVLSLGGPAAAAAWRFLMRLPTNPEMLEAVRRLQGFRRSGASEGGGVEMLGSAVEVGGGGGGDGGEGWKALLGLPGSHRMLYTLQIVDGVLDFVTGGGDGDGDGHDRPGRDKKEACAMRKVRSYVRVIYMCVASSTGICIFACLHPARTPRRPAERAEFFVVVVISEALN